MSSKLPSFSYLNWHEFFFKPFTYYYFGGCSFKYWTTVSYNFILLQAAAPKHRTHGNHGRAEIEATRVGGGAEIEATRVGGGAEIEATRVGGGAEIEATRVGGGAEIEVTRVGGGAEIEATRVGGRVNEQEQLVTTEDANHWSDV